MDNTYQFSREVEQDSAVQPQQSPANLVAEELNELELDAIAGGHCNMANGARAASIPVITGRGPRPEFAMGLSYYE